MKDVNYITKENTPTLKVRKYPIIVDAVQINEPFTVDTLEGHSKEGKAGDYLMIGVRGEKYPIDKSIFEETYEIVSYPVTE